MPKKVLVLGAHTDDAEIGAGGTIHRLVRQGVHVKVVVFSRCEDEVPKGWSESTLAVETVAAMNVLGVTDLQVLSFPNKSLEMSRQEILDEVLYPLARSGEYGTVITHSSYTSNQDHMTIHNETLRAFRGASILGYASPSSDYGFAPNPAYFVITADDLEAKVVALREFRSQYALKRPYFAEEFTRSIVVTAGVECQAGLAERYEPIRLLLGRN